MEYIDPVTGIATEEIGWSEDDEADFSDLFPFGEEHETRRTGIWAIIGSSVVSHPYLSGFELVAERIPDLFTRTLRKISNDTVEVAINSVDAIRFGDYLETIGESAVIGTLNSPSIGGSVLLRADPVFVSGIVDLLLGGNRGGHAAHDRQFTAIEIGLVRHVLEKLAGALSSAFSGILNEPFSLARLETRARFATITETVSVCGLVKLPVTIGDSRGMLDFLMPFSALETVQDQLDQVFCHESLSQNDRWRLALKGRLHETQVAVRCVIGEKVVTLREIDQLSEGKIFEFGGRLDQAVPLCVGKQTVATGLVGRNGERLAVQVRHQPSKPSGPRETRR